MWEGMWTVKELYWRSFSTTLCFIFRVVFARSLKWWPRKLWLLGNWHIFYFISEVKIYFLVNTKNAAFPLNLFQRISKGTNVDVFWKLWDHYKQKLLNKRPFTHISSWYYSKNISLDIVYVEMRWDELTLKYWVGKKEMSLLWSKFALFNILKIIRFKSSMRRFVRKLVAI